MTFLICYEMLGFLVGGRFYVIYISFQLLKLLSLSFLLNYRLGRLICAVGHDGTVDAVSLMNSSAHKRLCISGARDRSLIIWDVDTITVRACYSVLIVHFKLFL